VNADGTAAWIDAFLLYVVKEVPRAPLDRLMSAAAALCARFGDYDPVEVAEAEWTVLPLGDPQDG